ncbi:sensor histidine kinase [Amycolatopsis silviterrae]|uniref:histidine kinase n=1 Tax=Amycolatopsis silviterrae TaxID=1656914 RepID=A0ABW5H9Z0_9PSEU
MPEANLARPPTGAKTVVAWAAFALSPLVLAAWAAVGGPPSVVPVLAMALPFGVVRRQPWAVLGLLVAELALSPLVPESHSFVRYLQIVSIDLAVGCLATVRRPRVSVGAAAAVLVAQAIVANVFPLWPGYGARGSVEAVAGLVIAWLGGNTLRLWRQNAQARRAHAAAEAVQAERLRIARELHDMVAHSIGVIAIQAGMGRRVIDTQPGEAGAALHAIEDASRDTLAGLRRMLGALRRSDAEPVAAPLGLADLDALVARSADAGLRVRLRRLGDPRPLPPEIDLSAFRIVQESVANVVRHAGTSECQVVLDQRDEELFIEVTDNGRGHVQGDGYGIPGMRERVALLRGEFSAGPRPGGGFRVTARLPTFEGAR